MALINSNIRPDYRPIGSNGTVLLADSTQPVGTRWGHLCESSISLDVEVVSATVSPSSVLCGSGFTNPMFSISYNPAPSSVSIVNPGYGAETPTGLAIYTYTWQGTGIFISSTPGNSEEFRIEPASQNCGEVASSVYAVWMQNIRWDSRATGTINSAFISGLANSLLSLDGSVAFTESAGSGEYIWWAFRSGLTPTFTCNGINGGFQSAVTGVSFTNAVGYTEQYQLWRSDYHWLGQVYITIVTE